MGDDVKKRLDAADIGYYGKPLDTLDKDDLIGLCLHLSQTIYEWSHKEPSTQDESPIED